jgi:hypothetical protein
VKQLRDLIGAALEIEEPTKVKILKYDIPSNKKEPIKVQTPRDTKPDINTEKELNLEDSIDTVTENVRIELPIKAEVRSMFNINKTMDLYIPGVTSAADFTYALRKDGPFKHKWDTVKYVLPDDEKQTTQDRNGVAVSPKYMLEMINKSGKFLLVVQRSNQWKLICLGAFAVAFHGILALYLYYF